MSALAPTPFGPEGIEVFPSGDPGRYFYVPRVQPEVGPSGSPAATLVKTSNGGLLQLGAVLTVDQPVLDAIAARLKASQDEPVSVRLEQAPIVVRGARLVIATQGGPAELARSQTSQFAPFTALFAAPLNQEQTKAVEEALSGNAGRLKVTYDIERSEKAGAWVEIAGDAVGANAELEGDATQEMARAWVERALADGLLRLDTRQWGADAAGILSKAVDTATEKAAAMALSMRNPPLGPQTDRSDRLAAEVRLEEPRVRPDAREADVADWFAKGGKASVLTAPEQPRARPAPSTVTVKAGFSAVDAPIAFIEVAGDGPPAVLRAPAWQAVTVNASGRLRLKVRYTSGAPPFETDLEASGGERKLQLEELGVAQVTLDASGRKAAGATQLKVDVVYERDDQEIESWPLKFRYGDWTETWFVVTGGPGLNGTLEYRWQETQADGSVITGGPVRTTESTIVI
jgi:hypothetical protein